MNTSDPNMIRGFGIANIVLSALAILAFALLGVFVGILGSMMTDPALSGQIASELHSGPSFRYEMDELYAYGYSDFDAEDVAGIMMLVSGGLAILVGLGAALSIVSLVAGILAVRNYQKPEKMSSVFGWSIAGAICALLCGRIISVVLLVLQTVCAHKQRQIASGSAQPSPAMGAPANQQAAYAYGYAPYAGAPYPSYATQQPYGAPTAGAGYASYAQPIPNAHPGHPAAAPVPMPYPAPAAQPIPNATPAAPAAASPAHAPASAPASEPVAAAAKEDATQAESAAASKTSGNDEPAIEKPESKA